MNAAHRLHSRRCRGRTYDRETGYYYHRARYYDPVARRFLSEDPAGLAGGTNLYAYAGNDPVDASDPSGLTVSEECPDGTVPLPDGRCGIYVPGGSGGSPDPQPIDGVLITATSTAGSLVNWGLFYGAQAQWDAQVAANSFINSGLPGSSSFFGSVSAAVQQTRPVHALPRACVGTFAFRGREFDLGEGFAFAGAIVESEGSGFDDGALNEVGLGGEGGNVGVAAVTSARSLGTTYFGFVGTGLSAGPLAGFQVGIIFAKGQGGMYLEGHIGRSARGGGVSVTACGQ